MLCSVGAPCESVLASILMISCSLQPPRLQRCSGTSVSVVYRTCPLALKARPGDAPACVCVSLHPGLTTLPLQHQCTYYPLGIIILCLATLHSLSPPHVWSSPWAWLDLDTEVHSEGRRAVALCSQHAERHWLHCGSKQVGGGDGKWGVLLTGCQGLWAGGKMREEEGCLERTCCPAAHLPAVALLSPLVSAFI